MLDRGLSLLTGRVLQHTSRLTLACVPPRAGSARCRPRPGCTWASAWRPLGPQTASRQFAAAALGSPDPSQQAPADLTMHRPVVQGSGPLYMRRTLEAMAPWEPFRVAGVSFEDRQEAVQSMQVGEPVMLVREPWNEYDNKAVAVYSLGGQSLGYVPRACNLNFQFHEFMLGHVEYAGCEPHSHMWGLRVLAQPELMPAYVSPFPPQLLAPAIAAAAAAAAAPHPKPRGRKPAAKTAQAAATPAGAALGSWPEGLSAAVGPARWQQLLDEARAKSKGRCEVTGAAPEEATLELVPEWQYNTKSSTIRLQGLSLVCQEVALVRRALDLSPGSEEQAQAIKTLVLVNGWRNLPASDTFPEEEYLDTMRAQRQRLMEGGWTLDLGH